MSFLNESYFTGSIKTIKSQTSLLVSNFPIGLVKTKSDFIVRSVETGIAR